MMMGFSIGPGHITLPASLANPSLSKLTAVQQPVQLLATSGSSGRSAAVTT